MTTDDPIYAIRRANLRFLTQTHGDSRRLALALGVNESRVSQLLTNPARLGRMSEKVARRFESSLKLDYGWFDINRAD